MAATAASMSLADSVSSFYESIQAANAAIPASESITSPENGISLLDVKNELFLSYLQNLALRNLEVIRSVRQYLPGAKDNADATATSAKVQSDIVEGLVRQRVYLEKGVRPLEDRLKYTIDKTLRAADESDKTQQQTKVAQEQAKAKAAESGSDNDSDSEASSEEEEMALAPNRSTLGQEAIRKDARARGDSGKGANESGVYRPPRVTATSMPDFDKRKSQRERPQRSRTLDEYVSSELAAGPTAEPSIGAMIAQGGRRQISAREREVEQERRDYEETHFTRLQESKKDKSKRRTRDGGFGGEDWRGLGDGLDKIDSLTRGVKKRDKEGALERSRKRRATEDAPRQDGTQGGLFDKRKKRMMKKLR